MELAVRPAEGDALLTGPHVGGEVRVGGLHIRPRGSLGELHLGGTRLHVEGSRELAAGGLLMLVLVGLRGRLRLRLGLGGRLRCRVRLLIVVLGLGQVGVPITVRAVQVQVLPCEQGAATLGGLAHNRREQLAVLAVTVVSPDLNHVLLRSIQGVCRKIHGTVQVAVTVGRSLGGVVKLDNVAGCQNRGVRALLTNHELNAPNGVNIAVKPLATNVQIL